MNKLAKLLASGLGTGFIPAPGTAGSAAAAIIWFFLARNGASDLLLILLVILSIPVGIWASNKVIPFWGKDPSKVVIDEWSGMWISLLFIPATPVNVIGAFALFRFFDILKPIGIRKAEKLPKGLGVMADDWLAGIASLITLHLIILVFDTLK